MSAIAPPRARPVAAFAAAVIGLAMIGIAVVAVRDLAVDRGWATGSSWTGDVAERLDGTSPGAAVVAAGIILVVIGLWVALLALSPARRTHQQATSGRDVWVTDNALAALVTRAAEDTPGVAGATVRARRSRIAVKVESDRPDVETAVQTNVRAALEGLTDKAVTVKTEKVTYDS